MRVYKESIFRKFFQTTTAAVLILTVMPVYADAPVSSSSPSDVLADARRHISDPVHSPVHFRQMDAFFPTEVVRASDKVMPLDEGLAIQPGNVMLDGQLVSFDEALMRTHTNALLVIHDGKIVYEDYYNEAVETDEFIGWSISKSVTSILTGILLEQGVIESLDSPIDQYVPTLIGTAYEGVTMHQMLMQEAGTSYQEHSPSGYSDTEVLRESSTIQNRTRFTDVSILPELTRKHAPGTKFNYSTLTSSLIGLALENASGMSMADLTETLIWKPAGMEADAYWLLDGNPPEGRAIAGGTFNATARDFARLGLMMLNDGESNGVQIVPSEWVALSTTYLGTEPRIPKERRAYHMQWWTTMNTKRFEAIGIHGQFVSVDPETNSIIVKMSYWPDKGGLEYELDTLALFDSIRSALPE